MKLEIGNFYVKDIVFGSTTGYSNSVLTINKEEALSIVREDSHITEADIIIVKPGDKVRIVPVKDAIEPRCRLDGKTVFPGVLGNLHQAGEGTLHALKGCSVLGVAKHFGGFQDGLIDMSGEGAKYSYFSTVINVCLVAHTDEEFEHNEQQKKNKAVRWASLKLAEYLGKSVMDKKPEETEVFNLDSMTDKNRNASLPKVAMVLQVQSQMEEAGYNTLNYGWDTNTMLPTVMHPNEILGGAVISGSFMPCSSKWSTYDYQNFPMIKKLYSEHNKSINFLGVIFSNLNVSLEQKERSVLFVAQIAKTIGADAAVVAEEGYGNPDADFTACLVALEDVGVKTIGLTNESTGRDGGTTPLTSMDTKSDAIVSCGNVSEMIELPAMETVVGELESLGRDGLSGGWANDDILGGSVRKDGSIIMENNAMFCGDQVVGWSPKTMSEF